MMSLPLSIRNRFEDTYDGCPAAVFDNVCEANNFEASLKLENVSFQTKIIKRKKRKHKFVIKLIDT